MAPVEQHFLTNTEPFRSVLAALHLRGRDIVEIGAGTGALTRVILDCEVRHVDSFEIEPGLCRVVDDRLTLHEVDAQAHRDWASGVALVSAPPYSLLPFIIDQIAARHIHDVALLIPQKAWSVFRDLGFFVSWIYEGADFEPPADGRHLVVVRGFAPPAEERNRS